ncbi:MAG: hypothetical protein WDM71_02050 [Ferruginibacter sp.]
MGRKNSYSETITWIDPHYFLIDEKGIIRKIFLKPKSKEHTEEILEAWKEIGK